MDQFNQSTARQLVEPETICKYCGAEYQSNPCCGRAKGLMQVINSNMDLNVGLLFQDWEAWAAGTFPKSTVHSKLKHLQSEVKELQEEPENLLEYADCMALLVGAASKVGFTFEDILEALWMKLDINKTRQWGKLNDDGYVEHIEHDVVPQEQCNG